MDGPTNGTPDGPTDRKSLLSSCVTANNKYRAVERVLSTARHTDCGEAGSAGSRVTESEDHAMWQWEKI